MDLNEAREWTQSGFLGGLISGAACAAQSLVSYLRRDPSAPDVREAVVGVSAKVNSFAVRFDAFQAEEILIHVWIEQERHDTLLRSSRRHEE